jgi:hypothetical protein
MLASIQPLAPDVTARSVDVIAPTLNGSWDLKKSSSDSMVPFLKHMGAPWAVQQIADSATPTRTFELTSRGMVDTQVTTGIMGRIQRQEWYWIESPILMAMGGTFPGYVSFDTEGHLVTKIMHPKGPVVTVFDPITQTGSELTLVLRMIVLGAMGEEVLAMRRVFTRST